MPRVSTERRWADEPATINTVCVCDERFLTGLRFKFHEHPTLPVTRSLIVLFFSHAGFIIEAYETMCLDTSFSSSIFISTSCE